MNKENIGATYSIYNIQGKLVLEGKLEQDTMTIKLEGMPAGNYIFYIQQNGLSEHQLFNVLE